MIQDIEGYSKAVKPNPFYIQEYTSLENFILTMLSLGTPLEISLVGSFDKTGRGSRRDVDLPLHRDGEYSQQLAEVQGGIFVKKENIDYVGLYCIKNGSNKCVTIIKEDNKEEEEINLITGQGLVFDNKKVMHGRKGIVGDRLLLRIWIKENE